MECKSHKTKAVPSLLIGLAILLLPGRLVSEEGTGGSGPVQALAAQESDSAQLQPWMAMDLEQLLETCATLDRVDWVRLSSAIGRRFAAHDSGHDERSRLLDLAAQAPAAIALPLGIQLWSLDSTSFGIEHRLAFAAYGVRSCESALEEHVAARQRSLCTQNIGPAVFLALRGVEAGRPILQRAWDWTDLERDGAGRALLVAFALEQLDSDGALDEMRHLIASAVRAATTAGSIDLGRRLALEAHGFDQMLGPGDGHIELSELAWFGEKLGRHCQERGLEPEGPGAHFDSEGERLADVRALSLPRGARPIRGRATFLNVQSW